MPKEKIRLLRLLKSPFGEEEVEQIFTSLLSFLIHFDGEFLLGLDTRARDAHAQARNRARLRPRSTPGAVLRPLFVLTVLVLTTALYIVVITLIFI